MKFQPYALVGVRADGSVRAVFCVDSKRDEKEAVSTALSWESQGRIVKRCSQTHAFAVKDQWIDEGVEVPA